MAEATGRPLVIYHGGGCHDGFTAAFVAWRTFGDAADYVAASYGEEPPEVAGRPVFILDFSSKRPVLAGLAAQAASLTLLDHHRTALDDLAGLWGGGPPRMAVRSWPAGQFPAGPGTTGPVTIVLDMEKSGAMLAWEHFFPGEEPPQLVRYVQDRDLWTKRLLGGDAVSAYLRSRPMTFATWDELLRVLDDPHGRAGVIEKGEAILAYQDQLVAAICRNAREVELGGHKVLAANTSVLFSEVAGRLAEAEGRPFGAAWFLRADGLVQWSLRARGGFDVAAVAEQYGGGGHRAAAGCQTRPGEIVT